MNAIKSVGTKLKAAREMKGMSISAASRESGFSRQQISRWERGESDILMANLAKLCDCYDVDCTFHFRTGEAV